MKKLIIIPAYNEANNLLKLVETIKKTNPDFDYVIINDGSTDNTEKVCRENRLNFISLPINLGIGGAVQTGYKYAKRYSYDIAVQMDGDGQHEPKELAKLIEPIVNKEAHLTIGSRFIHKEGFQSSLIRRIGIKYFSSLITLLTRNKITDPTSGFRVCNKQVIDVFCQSYPRDYPEPESIMSLLRMGYVIKEVPVKMKGRENGSSSITNWRSVYYAVKVSLAMLIDYTKTSNPVDKGVS